MPTAPCLLARVGPWLRGAAEGAVADPSCVARHGVGDEDDLAAHRLGRRGLELGHAVEADDFGGDSLRRGRAAVAERGDDQRLREGREDLGLSSPADPDRHVEVLDADIGEAHRGELRDRPGAGAGFRFRAGEPRPDLGRQSFDDVPGIIVAVSAASRSAATLGSTGGGRPGRGGDGGGGEQQSGDKQAKSWVNACLS